MQARVPTSKHHQPQSRIRTLCGWLCIAAGIAMLVLPGPGLLGIALGIILLGRNHPLLRRAALILRLRLRRLRQADHALVQRAGRWLYTRHRESRLFIHDQLQRHARGEPFAPLVRIWIGLTILFALIGCGVSMAMMMP